MKTTNFEFSGKQNIGMPLQASPVERTMVGAGAISSECGLGESAWWDTLASIAQTALPIAGQVARML